MKKLIILLSLISGMSWSVNAQAKKPVTVTINTPTVQCEQCQKNIENYMKREEGVTKVNVNYKSKKTTVTFLPNKTNIENVRVGIANAGYDADDEVANEDSYKKLPTCCKKPEDRE